MSFTLTQIFLLGVGYLSLLFACGWLVEKDWLPKRLVRHPLIYILALGMYASAWAFYGSFGMAERYGYGYLTYYLGIAGAFVLAPVLLLPLLRLTRTYQLTSLPDLLAFRYRSRWVGMLVTLGLLFASMPLLALQIQAIGDVIHLLTNESSPYHLAFVFCAVITLFAILFGARHISLQERHESLLVAIALESLVKLVAFLLLGGVALFTVFGGFEGLESWLATHGDTLAASVQPLEDNQWRTLLLLFVATAVSMPHIFHIIFTENPSEDALMQATWMLPLFLLLLALPVPVIYWAHQALQSTLPIEYASLSLGGYWSLLSFIAGLAAASGTIIVMTLALAPMVLNHLVLTVYQPPAKFDIYYWLVWMRRLLIASLIFIAYLVYLVLSVKHDLATLGLTAFIGTLQFLPGILALLYWPAANRKGLLAGLTVGFGIWFIGLGLPLMFGVTELHWPGGVIPLLGMDDWYQVTLVSITLNILIFILISLTTEPSEEEKIGAQACSQDSLLHSKRLQLKARNSADFIRFLSIPLGQTTAQQEVQRALKELSLHEQDARPYALRRLRDRIQANLSGMMGPAVAQELIDRYLPWKSSDNGNDDDIHFVERHLEDYRTRLTGMAKELDKLRRHHRQTLLYLPVGICTLGRDQEVLMWNHAMEKLTGICGEEVIGSRIRHLPAPWNQLLDSFLAEERQQVYRQALELEKGHLWLSLHKARLDDPVALMGGTVLLVEDQSDVKHLEDELIHNERLASIGRLAAGVAHEIGNPVTGISSLAQNLKYDAEDPETVRETSLQILQLTQRITRIVQSLVSFSHAGRHKDKQQQFEAVNLASTLDEAINLISLSPKGRHRFYQNLCPQDLYIQGDAQRLIQVFVNLIANARDATHEEGQITCTGKLQGSEAWIEIHDDGCGIASEELEHLFDPFYTTKEAGEGTGLGLALVYSIVEEHSGQIHAISPSPLLGKGSCFQCRFPLSPNLANQEIPDDHESYSDR
ncbi:PAS domain S-box-containing protein [Marinospirillum celere]|uniref:histidine kinase n=1 Tax=Marinospirillum celere TaxID=1122252 RepID=A0A1I1IDF6_9GAMM|nr:ATP-binding protein [Marinospirillum celere]SFC34135.1 PAS domain S-box-containing protein [Marinospirillum celere]